MLRLLELILEIVSGVVADSLRSRQQLLAENAMLRQQVINLRRAVKRPRLPGATVIKIPPSAPNCNAICERFLGSVRRECLNHILILSEDHLRRALRAFCAHLNMGRPHQGIGQRVPADNKRPRLGGQAESAGAVVEFPVLGGLHHEYRMAA